MSSLQKVWGLEISWSCGSFTTTKKGTSPCPWRWCFQWATWCRNSRTYTCLAWMVLWDYHRCFVFSKKGWGFSRRNLDLPWVPLPNPPLIRLPETYTYAKLSNSVLNHLTQSFRYCFSTDPKYVRPLAIHALDDPSQHEGLAKASDSLSACCTLISLLED